MGKPGKHSTLKLLDRHFLNCALVSLVCQARRLGRMPTVAESRAPAYELFEATKHDPHQGWNEDGHFEGGFDAKKTGRAQSL